MRIYRRRLPHVQPEGRALFVTWRLRGSLPQNRIIRPKQISSGRAFVYMDRLLDAAVWGPTWFREAKVAGMVAEALKFGAEAMAYYDLHCWVIMPNHVHILITPLVSLSRITQALKGFTAREANQQLERRGEPFWQDESYDHWVRNAAEFERIAGYIEANPVRAGLSEVPEKYRWSSAFQRSSGG